MRFVVLEGQYLNINMLANVIIRNQTLTFIFNGCVNRYTETANNASHRFYYVTVGEAELAHAEFMKLAQSNCLYIYFTPQSLPYASDIPLYNL